MGRHPAGKRPKRVAHRLQAELARLIQVEAADPRLALVTVTDVRVDRELEFANIWVCTADGSSEHKDDVLAALEHARGFLRSEVAARVRLRRVPQLIFHWDFVPERAARIEGILGTLNVPAPQSRPVPSTSHQHPGGAHPVPWPGSRETRRGGRGRLPAQDSGAGLRDEVPADDDDRSD